MGWPTQKFAEGNSYCPVWHVRSWTIFDQRNKYTGISGNSAKSGVELVHLDDLRRQQSGGTPDEVSTFVVAADKRLIN